MLPFPIERSSMLIPNSLLFFLTFFIHINHCKLNVGPNPVLIGSNCLCFYKLNDLVRNVFRCLLIRSSIGCWSEKASSMLKMCLSPFFNWTFILPEKPLGDLKISFTGVFWSRRAAVQFSFKHKKPLKTITHH